MVSSAASVRIFEASLRFETGAAYSSALFAGYASDPFPDVGKLAGYGCEAKDDVVLSPDIGQPSETKRFNRDERCLSRIVGRVDERTAILCLIQFARQTLRALMYLFTPGRAASLRSNPWSGCRGSSLLRHRALLPTAPDSGVDARTALRTIEAADRSHRSGRISRAAAPGLPFFFAMRLLGNESRVAALSSWLALDAL